MKTKLIVSHLEKTKKNNYQVTIDNKIYTFEENIILQYKLLEGQEIDEDILKLAIENNELEKYYNQALSYAINYAKSKRAVIDYLMEKGLNYTDSSIIVNRLVDKKLIEDDKMVLAITDTLLRKANGKKMIEAKLEERKYSKELIEDAISSINEKDYEDILKDYILKYASKQKVTGVDLVIKIKKHLLSRGYSYEDISFVDKLVK